MSDDMARKESPLDAAVGDDHHPGSLPAPRQFIWFMMVAITITAVFFTPLPAYDYDRAGLRLHVRTTAEVWRAQIAALTDVALGGLVASVFTALIAVFLVASAVALWYALYPQEPCAVFGETGNHETGRS